MTLTVSATNTELPKPVNVIFQQTLLRNARVRCPYFVGSTPGNIERNRGTASCTWRRIENLSAATSALSELTGEATYMQSRTSAALSVTDYTATASKYGNFIILNEEASVLNFSGQMDKIMEVIGINAGQSLNQLQRNVLEDNATLVYAGGAASDGAVTSKITKASIQSVVNTLEKNSTMTFNPQTNGDTNVGTTPLLPSFWGLTHPDVAIDISELAGFKSVETYGGQTQTAPGEFGAISVAGKAVRFISSEDASVDADAGGTKGSTGLNGTSDVDLYTTVIFGRDAHGSVGLGEMYGDGIYVAGDSLGPIDVIAKGLGSGGTSDPYDEISTVAWKAWHTGKITNPNWIRGIRSGSTSL
jgi:N4-gp56 family major capsid protein